MTERKIHQIVNNDATRMYCLPNPVIVNHTIEEDIHWFRNEELGIFAVGEKMVETWEMFSNDFIFLIDEYAHSDDPMTEGAIKLKNKVLWHLGEVIE